MTITTPESRHETDREDQLERVNRFKALIKERSGTEFPQDPWKQLWAASGPCSARG